MVTTEKIINQMVTTEKIINQITYQIYAESIRLERDRPQERCSRNLSNKKNYDSEKLMSIGQNSNGVWVVHHLSSSDSTNDSKITPTISGGVILVTMLAVG